MINISRRKFLQVTGTAAVAAAVLALPVSGAGRSRRGPRNVRVRLLPMGNPRLADETFCHRARFPTAADAMRAAARRGVAAEIYRESAI